MNILICDDDKDIVAALKIYLTSPEYTLFEAFNGKQALEIIENTEIHLLLMDIMMPLLDGIEATVKIRQNHNIPIILLTAKSEESDKLLGLGVGADDYITKPFSPLEVQARVRSQLRRYTSLGGIPKAPGAIVIGNISLDDEAKKVLVDDEEISLTPIEYDILKLLMQNAGKVFSTKDIYTKVWQESPLGSEAAVAVHIRHLREKIEISPSNPRYVKVVWGHGYKIEKG